MNLSLPRRFPAFPRDLENAFASGPGSALAAPVATGSAGQDFETLGENHFILEIPGLAIGAFSELAGLSVERDLFEYAEGGQHDFVHKLPGGLKYPNLTLKRGVTNQDALQRWFWASRNTAQLRDITVKLVDPAGRVRRTWAFTHAFPVKWTGPKLAAGSDNAATEELEVAHQGMVVFG